MPEHRHASARPSVTGPWVIDTRDIGRRAGSSRAYQRSVPAEGLGLEGVIAVPAGGEVRLDLLLESVVEGVLVTGTASTHVAGECSRCLDPLTDDVEVTLTELYAYPDSATDETTEEDEVSRLQDDLVDLEPVVRDALVLALPQVPLCSPDCLGLCVDCGGRLADLGPDHGHETIDPRWAALREQFGGNRDNPEEN
ncbi:YceD family protein [Actinosynnema sp. NPDC020468]|uniref:YceD family protein n=1 Tax=Actinosynnema sp. NPDC020468 TaxID=3154488 RepID=UPI0033E25854